MAAKRKSRPRKAAPKSKRTKGVPDKFTPKVREQYLEALAELGSFRAASAKIGVGYQVVYHYRKEHPDFDEQCNDARLKTMEACTSQLKRLVLEGVVEPIFDRNGIQIGERRKYSERLLLAWLRKLESGSWLDKGQVTHQVTGQVQHEHTGRVEVEHMTPDQQRAARDFLRQLRQPAPSLEVERN